jgi:hypothetical protein
MLTAISPESDYKGIPLPIGSESVYMYFLAVEIAATMALLIGHFAVIVRNRFLPPKERPHFRAWKPIRPPRRAHTRPASEAISRAA